MKLSTHGIKTSPVEVTHISGFGIWLLAHNKELFLSYDEFPWFKEQTVASILNVEEPSANHYYWPSMDVDLTLDMIEHPDRYPLKAKY
jgi:hypothetical protein